MKLPYVNAFTDRYGNKRFYYRRGGKRHRIDGDPGSPEWCQNYTRIHTSFESSGPPAPDHETFRSAVEEYYSSYRFRKLSDNSKTLYRSLLAPLVDALGSQRLADFTRGSIIQIRNKIAQNTPSRAAVTIAVLKGVFSVACDNDVIDRDPTKGISKPEGYKAQPHRRWTDTEIKTIVSRGRPYVRRAVAVLLYTGLRISDATSLRRDAAKSGVIRLVTQKTKTKVAIPVHTDLETILAQPMAVESMWLISGARGQQLNKKTLYAAIKYEAKNLGLAPDLVPHGLRKNAVIALIEAGAQPRQIQAITGQSLSMIEYYGQDYSREGLARSAIELWENR